MEEKIQTQPLTKDQVTNFFAQMKIRVNRPNIRKVGIDKYPIVTHFSGCFRDIKKERTLKVDIRLIEHIQNKYTSADVHNIWLKV